MQHGLFIFYGLLVFLYVMFDIACFFMTHSMSFLYAFLFFPNVNANSNLPFCTYLDILRIQGKIMNVKPSTTNLNFE